MNVAHSPLPWHVWTSPDSGPVLHLRPGIEATNNISVVVIGFGADDAGIHGDTPEEAIANAALIVRAVNCHADMLAALKRLLSSHVYADSEGLVPVFLADLEDVEAAHAAIAKAEAPDAA